MIVWLQGKWRNTISSNNGTDYFDSHSFFFCQAKLWVNSLCRFSKKSMSANPAHMWTSHSVSIYCYIYALNSVPAIIARTIWITDCTTYLSKRQNSKQRRTQYLFWRRNELAPPDFSLIRLWINLMAASDRKRKSSFSNTEMDGHLCKLYTLFDLFDSLANSILVARVGRVAVSLSLSETQTGLATINVGHQNTEL